jgi:hypothetical protein
MTGTIEDIPLTDVLQWLATSRKTGALKVKDADAGRLGALHLRDGQVFYAAISGSEGMHPGKALRRMLAWQKGTFELDNAVIQDPPVEISMSLEHMLMEAARQQDELAALVKRSSLPGPQSEIRLIKPSPVRWKDLEPTQLDVMQDLAEWGSWATVLDRSEHEDLTLYRALVQLHKQGVVEY